MVCLVNRKEAENKEEIRAARSPRGFSNLDFKNEGSKSAQSHLINEIETDSIDLSRLDQTFPKSSQMKEKTPSGGPPTGMVGSKLKFVKVLSPRVQLIPLHEGRSDTKAPNLHSSLVCTACAEPAPRVERAAPPSRPAVRRALESVVVF